MRKKKFKSVFQFKIVENLEGNITLDFDSNVMMKPFDKLTPAEQGALESINCLQAWFKGTLTHLGYLEKLLTHYEEFDTIDILKRVMEEGLPEDEVENEGIEDENNTA